MTKHHTIDLNEQETRARIIIDRTHDAFVEIDVNNVIVDWNKQAEIIFDWPRQQVIGKTFTEVVIPARHREVQNGELKHFRGKASSEGVVSNKQIETLALRRDGQEFPVAMTVFPVPSGNSVNLGVFIRNSNEWKIADQKFRQFLELAPDAMVIVNQKGNIVLVNSQTENIFGYGRQELLGQTVEKVIPDRSKFLAQHRKPSVSTGLELYALHKNGREFPVEVSLSPLETEEGLLISSAIRDITERKQFESDLLKQKELFQIILDSLVDGLIVADAEGKFWVINRAAKKITGIDYLEVPIEKWSEQYGFYLPDRKTLYPVQDLPLVQAMQGNIVNEAEVFIRNSYIPHGAWLSVSGAPMELGNGEDRVGVIVFRDISKRKQSEQKNAQLAAIVESSDDAIIGRNLNGVITVWNDAATRMFGYSKDEAIGQSNSIIIPPDCLEKEEAVIKAVEKGGGRTVVRHETVRQAKDGKLIPVSLTISPIRDQGGKIIGTSKITRDITESKRAEKKLLTLTEELKRSNAELEEFASAVSHDLQEPLRGVAGCLEIIEESYKSKLDDKVDKLIHHAVDGASRMHTLIKDLLVLSRVTTKGMTIRQANLSTVLDRVLENLEVPIKENHAIITHDSMPVLAVDSTQLIQLFQNVISNAIKFRGAKPPEIHIGVKQQNGDWLFSVRDNGIGFKQEYTDRIFLPFRRLHTREKYPGTGIGLAICKRIVERNGGSIWAESEDGKGATFYFTISNSKGNHG